jgi:diacylglycerol O-acyltransferase / wax synthase
MTASTAALQPLSGLDALFLQFESPEMPMHVGSLSLLELPKGHRGDFSREVRKLIGARLHLAEAFRRKLVPMPLGVANPVWMRCDDIDLDHHIRRVTLPKPGTLAQLEACVGRLHSQPLDRDRPLWELVVIDGLGGALTGHVGYYAKVHHAAIDGQAGVALAQAMLDLTPVPRTVPPPPEEPPVAAPTTARRLQLAAAQTTQQLRTLAKLVPAAAAAIRATIGGANALAPTPGQPAADAPTPPRGAPLLAPRTPLNVAISGTRGFTTASLPLADLKQVARALDASLNDIVLALCSGALRRWLAAHGGVPRAPIAAGVPFTVRNAGDASASNKVSMMRASLATHLADPAARLAQIRESMRFGKTVTGRLRALVPTDYPSLGSAWLVGGLGWLAGALGHRLPPGTHLPSLAPVAISNVPGPPMTLYVAGARVVHYWPASIVIHGLALNITVQSYADWLDIGLTACKRAVPDLARFKRHLAESFDELKALAARAGSAAAPADAVRSAPHMNGPAAPARPLRKASPAAAPAQAARVAAARGGSSESARTPAAKAPPAARKSPIRPSPSGKAARGGRSKARPSAATATPRRVAKSRRTSTPSPDSVRRPPTRRR